MTSKWPTVAQGMPLPIDIVRIKKPSNQTFQQEILKAQKPVVIENSIDEWKALSQWSPEYFAQRFGERKTTVYKTQNAKVVFSQKHGLTNEEQSFSSFVQQITTPANSDVQTRVRCSVFNSLPELKEDFSVPEYCANGMKLQANLWFSGAPSVTRLHFDLPHNLLAQVYGQKRFILFGPEQTKNLYQCSIRSSTPQFSEIDLTQTDTKKFPKVIHTQPIQTILSPGDLLFIPSRWWHYADSPEITMSLSFWWASWSNYPLVTAADWFKRLRGITR